MLSLVQPMNDNLPKSPLPPMPKTYEEATKDAVITQERYNSLSELEKAFYKKVEDEE